MIAVVDYGVVFWLSVYYHTFLAQGCQHKYHQCLALDIWGIGMASSGVAVVYLAYVYCCSSWWQMFYYSLLGGVITWYSVIWLHPKMVPGWVSVRRRFLALSPLHTVFYAIILLQPLHLNRYWPDSLPQTVLSVAAQPVAILQAGILVFFVMKIPERWWPGRFNIWGHSHQWWHLLLIVKFLFWRRTILTFMQLKLHTLC
ncbi:progestin and adipoQ receptor family member 3-like [Branchiostoma floridae]|uniref:Progestin and adipoQ receptor family member 3-like n=1 Tax=Branchiostoma floridae TaxID=7739 RepID=A0A9J7KTC6_BRAFL|nr:progestin and adipoQ receptor family member 3-like [Branchiostoma floridae]